MMRLARSIKRDHVVIVLILLIAFTLRFYNILIDSEYEFREGTWGMSAWRIIDGELPYRDFFHAHPPLSPFLLAAIFLIFGVGVFQARLFVISFSTFACFMIYQTGKQVDTKTGLLGSLIYAVTPLSIQYGMVAVNDFVAVTFCIVGYYFLTAAFMGDTVQWNTPEIEKTLLILAGVFMSLGVLVKTLFVPLFLAFIVILLFEGRLTGIKTRNQIENISFFALGFLIFPLLIYSVFYWIAGDTFIQQSFLQHLTKPPQSFESRLQVAIKNLVTGNYFFITFFLISTPFAVKTSYGRGLLICILILLGSVIFLVPQQYANYYHASIPFMAMVCGVFPLRGLEFIKSIRLRQTKRFMREIFIVVLAIILFIPIVLGISYPRLSERNDQAINWLEDHTSADEYILTDNLNINFQVKRRSPFAEISIDRTRLGQLNGEMFIAACYEFDIRAVVLTGRLFGRYKEYDVFLDFLYENYDIIQEGYIICWRNSPL